MLCITLCGLWPEPSMKWFDLAVTPKFSWPDVQVVIPFEGHRIVLQPRRQGPGDEIELAATVSVFAPDEISFEVGGTIAGRFLSRFAWSSNGGVAELFCAGSNNPNRPGRLGQGRYGKSGWMQVTPSDYVYLPAANSPEADLALGLFREGMSVNSAPFAFLSYFKVLNIVHGNGADQKRWINDNLQHLWYRPAVNRLTELQKSKADIGAYLYHQGRCAVAHANGDSLVNPDNYEDKRRMQDDLCLIKEISALYIEREFGVLSDSSFWRRLRDGTHSTPELLRKAIDQDGQIMYIPESPSS